MPAKKKTVKKLATKKVPPKKAVKKVIKKTPAKSTLWSRLKLKWVALAAALVLGAYYLYDAGSLGFGPLAAVLNPETTTIAEVVSLPSCANYNETVCKSTAGCTWQSGSSKKVTDPCGDKVDTYQQVCSKSGATISECVRVGGKVENKKTGTKCVATTKTVENPGFCKSVCSDACADPTSTACANCARSNNLTKDPTPVVVDVDKPKSSSSPSLAPSPSGIAVTDVPPACLAACADQSSYQCRTCLQSNGATTNPLPVILTTTGNISPCTEACTGKNRNYYACRACTQANVACCIKDQQACGTRYTFVGTAPNLSACPAHASACPSTAAFRNAQIGRTNGVVSSCFGGQGGGGIGGSDLPKTAQEACAQPYGSIPAGAGSTYTQVKFGLGNSCKNNEYKYRASYKPEGGWLTKSTTCCAPIDSINKAADIDCNIQIKNGKFKVTDSSGNVSYKTTQEMLDKDINFGCASDGNDLTTSNFSVEFPGSATVEFQGKNGEKKIGCTVAQLAPANNSQDSNNGVILVQGSCVHEPKN